MDIYVGYVWGETSDNSELIDVRFSRNKEKLEKWLQESDYSNLDWFITTNYSIYKFNLNDTDVAGFDIY